MDNTTPQAPLPRQNTFREFFVQFNDNQHKEGRKITDIIVNLLTEINNSRSECGHFNLDPMVVGHDTAPLYSMYLSLDGEQGKGFNRDFFRAKSYKGFKALAQSDLEVKAACSGTNALPKFENLIITDHWLADNDQTKNYIDTNSSRLRTLKNLELDLTSDEAMKDKTYRDLLYDFAIKFRSGKVDSVEQYFKILDEAKQIKLLVDCGLHRGNFEDTQDFFDELMESQQELPNLVDQLRAYVDKTKTNAKPLDVIKRILRDAGHDDFIKHICDDLILNKVEKVNAVWIYGAANSGKTCFLRRFQSIFDCAEYQQTRGKFDCKYKHGKIAPSFILIDEGALDRFFNPSEKYVVAKIFFEGNGLVLESKMKHPKVKWKGVPIVLTSNGLPSVMHKPLEPKYGEEYYQFRNRCNNYDAFQSRTNFVHMPDGHDKNDKFPYDAPDLALFMLDYIESQGLTDQNSTRSNDSKQQDDDQEMHDQITNIQDVMKMHSAKKATLANNAFNNISRRLDNCMSYEQFQKQVLNKQEDNMKTLVTQLTTSIANIVRGPSLNGSQNELHQGYLSIDRRQEEQGSSKNIPGNLDYLIDQLEDSLQNDQQVQSQRQSEKKRQKKTNGKLQKRTKNEKTINSQEQQQNSTDLMSEQNNDVG